MDINSQKYHDIVETAHQLFWKHGIKRVSIEEICREANVSKMTFYRFFKNKTELGMLVVKNILDDTTKKYRKVMKEDIPFEEKVKKQLLMKFEGTKEISMELVNDIYMNDKTGIKEYWLKRSQEFTQEVISDYKKAQEKGWIRSDIKLEFIMYYNSKIADMISDPKLVAMYDTMQDLIMEIANLFFYGIFPHPNQKK